MNFEIDVFEIIVLIGAWFACKWGSRALFLFLVAKVVGQITAKGKEQIGQIKNQVVGLQAQQGSEETNQERH